MKIATVRLQPSGDKTWDREGALWLCSSGQRTICPLGALRLLFFFGGFPFSYVQHCANLRCQRFALQAKLTMQTPSPIIH